MLGETHVPAYGLFYKAVMAVSTHDCFLLLLRHIWAYLCIPGPVSL